MQGIVSYALLKSKVLLKWFYLMKFIMTIIKILSIEKELSIFFYEVAQDALCGYTCTLYNYEVPLDGTSSKCQFSSRLNNTVYREMFASD